MYKIQMIFQFLLHLIDIFLEKCIWEKIFRKNIIRDKSISGKLFFGVTAIRENYFSG